MEILGMVMLGIGAIIGLIFGIQLLIIAFQQSILWGLGYLLIPFVSLIFIVIHWDKARTPFLRCLLSIPLYVIGFMLLPATQ